jgi:hypothetical protein
VKIGKNESMQDITHPQRGTAMAMQLCRRCGFHPVSPRITGYCSWDCHDADDEEESEEDEDGEQAA